MASNSIARMVARIFGLGVKAESNGAERPLHGRARADGRIVVNELEIVSSPEAKSHYADLQRLADEGMIVSKR